MSNLTTMVNAVLDVNHSASGEAELGSEYVNGDQLQLGSLVGISDLYWPHAITRAELLGAVLAQGKEPSDLVARRWLADTARCIGSDDTASATWLCSIEGKRWHIEARQYNVSATHCIRAIYADESGETDHELVDLADCESLGEWLESAAMVNGELTLN